MDLLETRANIPEVYNPRNDSNIKQISFDSHSFPL
jgi:hypothetical protein